MGIDLNKFTISLGCTCVNIFLFMFFEFYVLLYRFEINKSSSSSGRACSDLHDSLPPRLLVHHGCRKFFLVQSSVLSQLVDVGLGWTSDGSASVALSPQKCIANDFFFVSPAMSCKSHSPLSDHRGDILEITIQAKFCWMFLPGNVEACTKYSGLSTAQPIFNMFCECPGQ